MFAGDDHDERDADPPCKVIATIDERVVGAVRLYPLARRPLEGRPPGRAARGAHTARWARGSCASRSPPRASAAARAWWRMIQPPNVAFFERSAGAATGATASFRGAPHQPMTIPLAGAQPEFASGLHLGARGPGLRGRSAAPPQVQTQPARAVDRAARRRRVQGRARAQATPAAATRSGAAGRPGRSRSWGRSGASARARRRRDAAGRRGPGRRRSRRARAAAAASRRRPASRRRGRPGTARLGRPREQLAVLAQLAGRGRAGGEDRRVLAAGASRPPGTRAGSRVAGARRWRRAAASRARPRRPTGTGARRRRGAWPPTTGTPNSSAPVRRPASSSSASAASAPPGSRGARPAGRRWRPGRGTVTTAATPAARGCAATNGGQMASAPITRWPSPSATTAASSPSPPSVRATAARSRLPRRPGCRFTARARADRFTT